MSIQIAPKKVRLCLTLILVSALLGVLTVLPAFTPILGLSASADAAVAFVATVMPLVLVGLVALAVAYLAVRERRAWARIALLVLSMGATPLVVRTMFTGFSGENSIEVLLNIAAYGTLVAATLLSFSSGAREWFHLHQ
jgi:Na+/melibiose symporter-like transporter